MSESGISSFAIRRAKKPLWHWDPFVIPAMLVVATISVACVRAEVGVLGTLGAVVSGLGAAILAVFFLIRTFGAPEKNGELPRGGIERVSAPSASWFVVDDGARFRTKHEIVWANFAGDTCAVLCPDSVTGLGRELRIAVHAEVAGNRYRVGNIPRERGDLLTPKLRTMAAEGRYLEVPMRFVISRVVLDPEVSWSVLSKDALVEVALPDANWQPGGAQSSPSIR